MQAILSNSQLEKLPPKTGWENGTMAKFNLNFKLISVDYIYVTRRGSAVQFFYIITVQNGYLDCVQARCLFST